MKRLAALGLVILMGASEPASSPPAALDAPATIELLGWISGDWVVLEKDGRWAEEHWSQPRGGIMIGAGRTGSGATLSGFEYMRIAPAEDGRLSFFGGPQGAAPVAFALTGWGEHSAVFENPGHDYPKRISYTRKGRMLIAEISGDENAPKMRWIYEKR